MIVYLIDSDQRPDSNWHPLTSLSQITVRYKGIPKSAFSSNSQIYGRFIKSMSFSEQRSVCAFTLSHDGFGSILYIICIAYYIKWMQNVKVPGIKSVCLNLVSSTKKIISDPLIYSSLKAKSNTTLNGVESHWTLIWESKKQP